MVSALARLAPPSVISLRAIFGFCAVFVLCLTGIAGGAKAAGRDRVAAFLQVTGFDVAIESIALSASAAPEMLGLAEEDFGLQWQTLSEDVFDVELMQSRALDILEATLDEALLAHAAEFYASDLGQRLVAVENSSHMGDDIAKDTDGAALLDALKANDDPRIDLFKRMNHAIDPKDIGGQAMTEIQVRFLLAASYAGVISLRTDEEGLRAALNENAEEIAHEMEQSSLRNAAYTYQDFSVEEIAAYTEALEHPDMMTVYELMNAVHFEVMSNRFEALALRMGELQPAQEL
ncbi:DUF2059 domain-containing protein [Shimia marina]|uniref:DUF2059 domain-containing protein n=1 Tax=Shimia marina TaxID=321267 RepID=A0A0P1FET3_9RHOB|nr:DUF2059 domain-containing protein [Shimia marina]CUH53679.1 hypothetical protein SHM7688_03135 [Shimia marina]SFD71225.1 hypothetical protein SAMN04488037_102135 [Shimia marina]